MGIYIYNAKRSAIGKFKKSLSTTGCRSIGTQISKKLLEYTNVKKEQIDKVYVGNVLSAGLGQNIARQILIDTGIKEEKCATTVNMVCGSGLKAINLAYNEIKLGNAHCILVGGVENMSMSPILKDRIDEEKKPVDSMIYDALTDVFNNYHMGITAENVSEKYNISREEQDNFSYESQRKVQEALQNNKFKDEIVEIVTSDGNIFDKDEFPRADYILDDKEYEFTIKENGTVTAGNSSGINDGAAFLLIGDETIEAKPMVEIVDFAEVGCPPELMGMGPYYAINKLLEKNNLQLLDIDLYEINEAFASQSIAVIKELSKFYNVNEEEFKNRINVNGRCNCFRTSSRCIRSKNSNNSNP